MSLLVVEAHIVYTAVLVLRSPIERDRRSDSTRRTARAEVPIDGNNQESKLSMLSHLKL